MHNLYSNLITYRAREGRTPLEEFTSGALADLLSRMNAQQLDDFLRLFRSWNNSSITLPEALRGCDIDWTTEFSVWSKDGRWGRADIIGLVAGRPAIIIENKISASVSETQIGLYHQALETGAIEKPLLLFLTATTEPPQEFRQHRQESITYGTSRWTAIFQHLNGIGSSAQDATALEALSFEFSRFLEEQELHMDIMSAKDAAVLHLWITARQRIDNTVRAVFDPICSALSPWRKGTRGTNLSNDDDTYAYNASFRIDGRDRWAFLEAGIVYPDQSDWWAVAEKTSPQIVVFIWDNEETALPKLHGIDWSVSSDGRQIAITCDLSGMLSNPIDAHAKLSSWATGLANQLVSTLPQPA